MTVSAFISKWRKVELKERSAVYGWSADLTDDAILERLMR